MQRYIFDNYDRKKCKDICSIISVNFIIALLSFLPKLIRWRVIIGQAELLTISNVQKQRGNSAQYSVPNQN